jgi:SNF2 family DNA or RNA helicase
MLQRSDFREYQERINAHQLNNAASAAFVFLGAGKTVSTETTFLDLLDGFEARRMLVAAPLRVARSVWSDEVKEWEHLQGLSVSTIVGTLDERIKAIRTPSDIHTINVENLQWLYSQFFTDTGRQLRKWPWDTIVLDESQLFKSQTSERWKVMRAFRRRASRIALLTGTPIPNGLEDIWSQAYLMDGGARLGRTEAAFHDRWFTPILKEDRRVWVPRDHAKAEIEALMSDLTIALREEDYLDLPPVMSNYIRVRMNAAEQAKYEEMATNFLLEMNGRVITAVNAGVVQGKLLQLANGAVYDSDRNWHVLHNRKIDALVDLLDTLPRPFLIGYSFQHDLKRIAHLLDKQGRNWQLLRSDKSFDQWAAGEFEIGVLHPASAGHGLNSVYKSGAEHLVWFGLTNNLQHYLQLNGRLTGGHRRAGKNIVIHHIVCDDTEDIVVKGLLARKDATEEDFVSSIARRIHV